MSEGTVQFTEGSFAKGTGTVKIVSGPTTSARPADRDFMHDGFTTAEHSSRTRLDAVVDIIVEDPARRTQLENTVNGLSQLALSLQDTEVLPLFAKVDVGNGEELILGQQDLQSGLDRFAARQSGGAQ